MSSLKDIPVKVVTPALGGGGFALAILHELQGMLERLVASGQESCIDLRSLPMGPGDYQRLQDLLGQGEVSATVQAMGPTRVYETAYPGVWWVSHRNQADEMVADRIEVCLQPEMLKSHPADVEEGLERLKAQLRRDREGVDAAGS
jgi:hydrogenase-1 operon protein HyaF